MLWAFDFDHPHDAAPVRSEAALLSRLRTVRRGPFGAFILCAHRDPDAAPQLWLQVNGLRVYLHFFDDVSGANPGYQASGMPVADCPDEVRFIQVGESEHSAGNTMPDHTLCTLDDGCAAALAFFRNPAAMPGNIRWTPLWTEG